MKFTPTEAMSILRRVECSNMSDCLHCVIGAKVGGPPGNYNDDLWDCKLTVTDEQLIKYFGQLLNALDWTDDQIIGYEAEFNA